MQDTNNKKENSLNISTYREILPMPSLIYVHRVKTKKKKKRLQVNVSKLSRLPSWPINSK